LKPFKYHFLRVFELQIEKDGLEFVFDKDRPLGAWRNVVQALYGIELGL